MNSYELLKDDGIVHYMCSPAAAVGEAPNLTGMKGNELPQTYLFFLGKHFIKISSNLKS